MCFSTKLYLPQGVPLGQQSREGDSKNANWELSPPSLSDTSSLQKRRSFKEYQIKYCPSWGKRDEQQRCGGSSRTDASTSLSMTFKPGQYSSAQKLNSPSSQKGTTQTTKGGHGMPCPYNNAEQQHPTVGAGSAIMLVL